MSALTTFWADFGDAILQRTHEHLVLTLVALGIAILIALPTGIALSRCRSPWVTRLVMGAASTVQTVPSLALIAVVMMIFIAFGLPSIGTPPALVALVMYALLPILRNTYTGLRQVDSTVIEVATGMGMTRGQILRRIQLPLALPVIMAGIRIAAVWTIGVATLCAFIGAGGLGDLIMQGLRSAKRGWPYLIAGTVPAGMLALTLDAFLAWTEHWLTPPGIRTSEGGES